MIIVIILLCTGIKMIIDVVINTRFCDCSLESKLLLSTPLRFQLDKPYNNNNNNYYYYYYNYYYYYYRV